MTQALLHTKLYIPPLRPDFVIRPRLVERLDQGIAQNSRLILVSAPAGFGKTTLVAEWATNSKLAVAWLSLDEGDNDPVVFLAYLAAALGQIGANIVPLLAQPLASPVALVEDSLAALINKIAAWPERFLLILDDYQTITEVAIHQALTYLLKNLPAQAHLVLVSRSDPPLNLARLRGHGQLVEVRADALRFTPDEVAAYLNDQMNLALQPGDIQALESRTEGWVAGLQLAALSMRDRPDKHAFVRAFAGEHRYVMEYLMEEVFNRQPAAVQRFLSHTAILSRMNGDLCDMVTGNSNSAAMLERLWHENLFVTSLDDDRQWYRYHRLFVDLLANQLRQTYSAAEIREMHRRAATWYRQNRSLDEAIRHALQTQDEDLIVGLIEEAAPEALYSGRITTLLSWLAVLPSDLLKGRPRLQIYHGWAYFLSGQAETAEQLLLDARTALNSLPATLANRALRGELATLLATIASLRGDIPLIEEEAKEALANLPPDDRVSRARAQRALGNAYGLAGDTDRSLQAIREASELALQGGNKFLAADMLAVMAVTQLHQGRMREAAISFEQVVALGQQEGKTPQPFSSLGYDGLALIHLERNELEQAQQLLDQALTLSERGGIGYNLVATYTTDARLKQAKNLPDEALAALQKAEQALSTFSSVPNAVHLVACQVRWRLGIGDVAAADRWANQGPPGMAGVTDLDELPVVLREVQQVTCARLALAQGNLSEALAHCAEVVSTAEPAGRMARFIEAQLLAALALAQQGERAKALQALESSLESAQPEGYVRAYLEEGPAVAELLRAYHHEPTIPPELQPYTNDLLNAFVPAVALEQPLVEPLSEREIEVMRLVAAGYTNRQIAQQLVLSLHTVKKHTSNIYGKLGVSNRIQAVAKMQDLGLL